MMLDKKKQKEIEEPEVAPNNTPLEFPEDDTLENPEVEPDKRPDERPANPPKPQPMDKSAISIKEYNYQRLYYNYSGGIIHLV